MALIKASPSDFGVNGDYWRIIGIENWYGGPNQMWPDPNAKPVTFIHVAQYASAEARKAGAMSLQTRKVVLDGQTDAPGYTEARPAFLPDPTRAAAYAALKAMPEFAGAADD